MKDYEIKREQDFRIIVAELDAQKIKIYEMAAEAKQAGDEAGIDECYAIIDKILETMEAASQAARKIDKKHEKEANDNLFARLGV